MFKFFVHKKVDNGFLINEKLAKHMQVARVLHKEFICIYQEEFYLCKYDQSQEKALILKKVEANHEWSHDVVLAVALIDLKRFEWLIQKATELGATRIIPVFSQNVSWKKNHDFSKKYARWNDIAQNAAEQSFRNKPMQIDQPMTFNEVLKLAYPHKFLAYAKDQSKPPHSLPTNALFLIGPEGGFTPQEAAQATSAGFLTTSLGVRILRTETAALFILARINE